MSSDKKPDKVRMLAPRPAFQATRILGQLRERLRYLHYSARTEESHVYWVRNFIRFHGLRHPRELARPEVESFLSMLATERRVSVSTHRQALSALLFLYREVIDASLPWLAEIGLPLPKKRIPSVLTPTEVQRLLGFLEGEAGLLTRLLYGTGMRLAEGLSLRVKDVDFARQVIVVREGKGGKDRVVMLPRSLEPLLQQQLQRSRRLWDADRAAGRAGVHLPHALAAKYPRAALSWPWHWVFPSPVLSVDPRTGAERGITSSRRGSPALSSARRSRPASRRASPRTPCATLSLPTSFSPGPNIRTVQELLGHSDVSTTMIYTHVLQVAAGGTRSPLDALPS